MSQQESERRPITIQEQKAFADRLAAVTLFFLVAIGVNERIIYFVDPLIGLILNSGLLVILVLYTSSTWDRPTYRPLLSLGLVLLIRLLSLALPLHHFSVVYWYAILSIPMFVAATLLVQRVGFVWRDVGVSLNYLPLQLVIGLTGLAIGYVHYLILEPDPLADEFTFGQLLVPVLILSLCVGFFEELVFRGVIQHAMSRMLGKQTGVLYVAALYSILSLGYQSSPNMLFNFVISLVFSWIVNRTGSILGVSVAHALATVMLFLIMPFSPSGIP